jgi:hypothetical protein
MLLDLQGQLMTDPVCDKDGHAYERTAILQRLANGRLWHTTMTQHKRNHTHTHAYIYRLRTDATSSRASAALSMCACRHVCARYMCVRYALCVVCCVSCVVCACVVCCVLRVLCVACVRFWRGMVCGMVGGWGCRGARLSDFESAAHCRRPLD